MAGRMAGWLYHGVDVQRRQVGHRLVHRHARSRIDLWRRRVRRRAAHLGLLLVADSALRRGNHSSVRRTSPSSEGSEALGRESETIEGDGVVVPADAQESHEVFQGTTKWDSTDRVAGARALYPTIFPRE